MTFAPFRNPEKPQVFPSDAAGFIRNGQSLNTSAAKAASRFASWKLKAGDRTEDVPV
jgi:hypothetical protein